MLPTLQTKNKTAQSSKRQARQSRSVLSEKVSILPLLQSNPKKD